MTIDPKTSAPAGPRPVPALAQVHAYAPPRPLAPVDLLLSGNEGDRPPPELLAELAPRAGELLRSYPSARALEAALAQRLGVAPEQVYVAAGGDEVIDRLCRAYLAPERHMVLPVPTFVMFAHYANLAGATIDRVPWPEGPYPRAEVLREVRDDTAVVTVVSPNNPSGAVATRDDVAALAAGAPGALLVVDLAYAEYADEDLTEAALALPNAIVVRTLSKAWGLAGLRVGYAVGAAALVAPLRAAGGPFSVSGLSLAIAEHALRGGEARKNAHVARVREERSALAAELRALGLHSPPSQGNFALARGARTAWLRDGLAGLGIAVRAFPGEVDLADAVRITCPADAAAFERLRQALRAALRPQAILFDMDGVLADVSQSYRRAIVETAAHFGVVATSDDIARLKAQGNANNDWDITWRLVSAGGKSANLEQVTAEFEALYQGTEHSPGLWRHEVLLPPREVLQRLARRVPLGIVTGRPRRDAERFLRSTGTADLFATVVCLEDAPLKPDPAPVRLALRSLGVAQAWLVGDTPDDVRAARGAGVVPLAVPAPGEDSTRATDTLLRAGAARVLTDLGALEELLP